FGRSPSLGWRPTNEASGPASEGRPTVPTVLDGFLGAPERIRTPGLLIRRPEAQSPLRPATALWLRLRQVSRGSVRGLRTAGTHCPRAFSAAVCYGAATSPGLEDAADLLRDGAVRRARALEVDLGREPRVGVPEPLRERVQVHAGVRQDAAVRRPRGVQADPGHLRRVLQLVELPTERAAVEDRPPARAEH